MLQLQKQIAELPERPDRTVLSDSIPLFFIGRDRNGFWVARESEGRSRRHFCVQTFGDAICLEEKRAGRLCHYACRAHD